MISVCPYCNVALRLSEANKEKLLAALEQLKGKTLKIGCPSCRQSIEMGPEGVCPQENPEGLESGGEAELTAPGTAESTGRQIAQDRSGESKHLHKPPDPPDLSWLYSGKMGEKEIVRDVPTAIALVPEGAIREGVEAAFRQLDYQLYFPADAHEAIRSMYFKDYVAAVYYSNHEDGPFENHDFHKFMVQMSMTRRRYIYYVLIGPDFKTLYDLEALSNSANLVVNEKDMSYLTTILKKSRYDYDDLFGPYIALLKEHGKR